MNPVIWGPSAWDFLHTITFNYPSRPTQSDMEQAILFFKSLGNMLPCVVCQEHYKENIKKFPIELAVISRERLIAWLVNIHNQVNIVLGKKVYGINDIIEKYHNKFGLLQDNNFKGEGKNIYIYLSLLLILIVLVCYIIII